MNGGRHKSQPQWRPKPCTSSPTTQTPVRSDVSSGGSISSTSDEKSQISGKAARNNSGGSISPSVTPTGRQRQGSLTFDSGSSSRGGSISPSVTPTGRQRQGSLTFDSGSSSRGGSTRQSTPSFKSSNAADVHRDEQFGLKSGQLSSSDKDVKDKVAIDSSPVNLDYSFMKSLVHSPDVAQLSGESRSLKSSSEAKTPESTNGLRENENSEATFISKSKLLKFDLCPRKNPNVFILKPPLFSTNRDRRKENERSMGGLKGFILRPGMVLLKSYLSTSEQANILQNCRHHGLETLDFYQPYFGDSAKMLLKLMCFGQFWDPVTNQYSQVRPEDAAKPPPIPQGFLELVDRAIKDAQSFISKNSKVKNAESVLPSMKPDICLVNYYSNTGRLGLHQDKDESRESLNKGIPIVSFSLGDSAEFLYSDQFDVEKADKIILESGDVLIFGGKSRHIFHGVANIIPNTAPKSLLEETNFRPGRLNLTFRQRY